MFMNYEFLHSYWSVPAFNERWNVDKITQTITNMWYFAVSVEYLKRLNQKVVLHTDEFGKDLLDHVPYDEIHLTLEEIPDWMDPALWACGKMYALTKAPINAVHIDGDVFFKKPECLERLSQNADVITQCYEHISWAAPAYADAMNALQHLEFPKWASKDLKKSCNTGVLYFTNEDLKKDFLNTYFSMAEKISKDKKCRETFLTDRSTAPDIIIEQKFLLELAEHTNCRFKTILANIEEAVNIGYQHVIGIHKYPQLDTCKNILKKLNFDLFKKCEQKELDFLSYINKIN